MRRCLSISLYMLFLLPYIVKPSSSPNKNMGIESSPIIRLAPNFLHIRKS
nr:MAG TPA: hypothetical protein [Crassvirales sp.]